MNIYSILAIMLLSLATVNARHYSDRSDTESSDDRDEHMDNVRRARERSASQMRHRRRSWQMNYGYDYPQPPNPYYTDRRDNNQDLYPQILRLLDEISTYVKRPQPPPIPPQPIYVPYPVPYPVPQACGCESVPQKPQPTITNRFPAMEDTNQNWGIADTNEETEGEEGDGSRPISFQVIAPKRPSKRPAPSLEHGSTQAEIGNSISTEAPRFVGDSKSGRAPGMCDMFSLSCCNSGTPREQRECFTKVGCAKTYENGNGCDQDRLLSIIETYSKAYSPVA